MQRIIYILIVLFYLPRLVVADTYPEVIFDNSIGAGSYAKSIVSYKGNSWVENMNNRLLTSDTLFFTPGNSLSLRYISGDNGSWNARINYNKHKSHYRFNENDQLSFFIFVNSKNTKIKDLPRLYINSHEGVIDTISLDKYIVDYAPKRWIQVKIPCKIFSGLNKESIVTGVGFVQNQPSDREHHLFLDQIEFLPGKLVDVRLSYPAILSEAIGYDKMVHLKWQLPLSPNIRYVKIYRSTNGKDFVPVAMRPIHLQSCLDVVPNVGYKYFYKIAWVDHNYKESPASVSKDVETKILSDTAILNLIQAANINYFVENFDVNSGMYMPVRAKDKAIVSTKETAGAILSLIIGVENKQIPRNEVLNRISKISYFLLKAQHKNGIYPAYFDGRKGLPEYKKGTDTYDVQATASLIEALLIAREYFDSDQENEKDLRNRITSLYDQIEWTAILDENALLKPKFGLLDGMTESSNNLLLPIHGANEAINVYLLAISSRKYPLPIDTYYDAIYNTYGVEPIEQIDDFESNVYADSVTAEGFTQAVDSINYVDRMSKSSLFNPVYKYGVKVPFGEFSHSLMDLYKPFLTIKPNIITDSLVNWSDALKSYITYVKRRDNQLGVGAYTSDIWGFYQHKDSVGNYRINPSIAPTAMLVDTQLGKASVLALYKYYGNILFSEYGFKSWLDLRNKDESNEYLAMNQSTLAIVLENVKTGLIWKLYEKIPELKKGRDRLFNTAVLEVD